MSEQGREGDRNSSGRSLLTVSLREGGLRLKSVQVRRVAERESRIGNFIYTQEGGGECEGTGHLTKGRGRTGGGEGEEVLSTKSQRRRRDSRGHRIISSLLSCPSRLLSLSWRRRHWRRRRRRRRRHWRRRKSSFCRIEYFLRRGIHASCR
jgi:hypothetical protein